MVAGRRHPTLSDKDSRTEHRALPRSEIRRMRDPLQQLTPLQSTLVPSLPQTLGSLTLFRVAAVPRAPVRTPSPLRLMTIRARSLRYSLARPGQDVPSLPEASNDSLQKRLPETSCKDSHKCRR